jgi:hypothetical protein
MAPDPDDDETRSAKNLVRSDQVSGERKNASKQATGKRNEREDSKLWTGASNPVFNVHSFLFNRALSPFAMITPETFSHLEDIKKRAGHLWRFL